MKQHAKTNEKIYKSMPNIEKIEFKKNTWDKKSISCKMITL